MKKQIALLCAIIFTCTSVLHAQYVGVYHQFSNDYNTHYLLRLNNDGSFSQTSYLYSSVYGWKSANSFDGKWMKLSNGTIQATINGGGGQYNFKPVFKNKAVIGFVDKDDETNLDRQFQKVSSNPLANIDLNNIQSVSLTSTNKTSSNTSSANLNNTRFGADTDVLLYLDGKTFVNNYGTKMTFKDMASQFIMGGNVFYQPEVTVISETKAVIKYYNVTDPSSSVSFTIDPIKNTITTRSSGTVWTLEN